jgi:hypothetical protein
MNKLKMNIESMISIGPVTLRAGQDFGTNRARQDEQ